MTSDAPFEIADSDRGPDPGHVVAAPPTQQALTVEHATIVTAQGPLHVLVLPDGTIVAAQTHVTMIAPGTGGGEDSNARIAALLAQIIPLSGGGAGDGATGAEPPLDAADDPLMRSVQRIIEVVNGGGGAPAAQPPAIEATMPGRLSRINPSAGRRASGPTIDLEASPDAHARFTARFAQSRFESDVRPQTAAESLAIGRVPAGATADWRHLLRGMAGRAGLGDGRVVQFNAVGLWGLATLFDHPSSTLHLAEPAPRADGGAATGTQLGHAAIVSTVVAHAGHGATDAMPTDAPAAADAIGSDGEGPMAAVSEAAHEASTMHGWTAPSPVSSATASTATLGMGVSLHDAAGSSGFPAAADAGNAEWAAAAVLAPTTLTAGLADTAPGPATAEIAPVLLGDAGTVAAGESAIAGDADTVGETVTPLPGDGGTAGAVGEIVDLVTGDVNAVGDIVASLLGGGAAGAAADVLGGDLGVVGEIVDVVAGDVAAVGEIVSALLGDGGLGGTVDGAVADVDAVVGAGTDAIGETANGVGLIAAGLLGTADEDGNQGLQLGSALPAASEALGVNGAAAVVDALGDGEGDTSLALASVLDMTEASAVPAAPGGTVAGADAGQGTTPHAAASSVDTLVHQVAQGLLNGGHA